GVLLTLGRFGGTETWRLGPFLVADSCANSTPGVVRDQIRHSEFRAPSLLPRDNAPARDARAHRDGRIRCELLKARGAFSLPTGLVGFVINWHDGMIKIDLGEDDWAVASRRGIDALPQKRVSSRR